MSKIDQYSRRIANYLFDDMDQAERAAFEADLNIDPDLAFEFKRQSEMVEYLKTKAKLEEIENSPDMAEAERVVEAFFKEKDSGGDEGADISEQTIISRKPKAIRRIIYPLLAAASIVLAVLLIRSIVQENLGSRLYASHYKPLDEVSFNDRGEGIDSYEIFRQGMEQYLDQDYSASTRTLSKLVAEHPDFAEAQLFLGLSLMGEEAYDSSAKVFKSLLENTNKYEPEAKWYLALCYLKLEDYSSTKSLVDELSNVGGEMGKNAQIISNRLGRIE